MNIFDKIINMKLIVPKGLLDLSKKLEFPLYIVGGYVRNFLIDKTISFDIDLASPILCEEFLRALEKENAKIKAVYKRTGTIKFSIDNIDYEFTSFREDSYLKDSGHTPEKTTFTTDIKKDALRRDFKCNAVYYDVKEEKIVDPLNGVLDIKNRILDTVKAPKEVFKDDGLRLLRLARFSGELNFKPTSEVMLAMKEFADNILGISPERIKEELKAILVADKKYPFSDKRGHYTGLKILDETRVLDRILPELTLGRNMEQRKDFHDHDVLEHSLRCVLYADSEIRLSALLHDIGKPYCMVNFNKFSSHEKVGEEIAKKVLERLKFSNLEIEENGILIGTHMLDIKLETTEKKLRVFIVKNARYFQKILALKQADFSACKDDLSVCPVVIKWKALYEKMVKENTPFSLKELAVSSTDIMALGYKGKRLGEVLEKLFIYAIKNPSENKREILLKVVKGF